MENLLISACLLGVQCRYDGGSKPVMPTVALMEQYHLIPICPEQLGGLPTPREPSERRADAVVSRSGADVTAQFRRGAEQALHLAKLTAEVTHNHPEGIKGAQATAAVMFLARTGSSKADIRTYVEREFGYDLSRSCDEIRPDYHHVESCQETVPQAITAFLESADFEDALRTAVSLGGDSDTLAAITGSIAEAFYGVPEDLKAECRRRLTPELESLLLAWEARAA